MSVPIRETSLGAAVVPPRAVETDRARLATELSRRLASELTRAEPTPARCGRPPPSHRAAPCA